MNSTLTAGAVARALPEALRPAWMHETWSGTFGSSAMRSVVDEATSSATINKAGITGRAHVDGRILAPDEGQAGVFTRWQRLHPSGRLEVHHDYLKLNESAQGTGFARAFNDQAFARYADAGIDDATVFAALDVGGYAWARQGFELAEEGASEAARLRDRGETLASFVDEAHHVGSITDEQFAQLGPRLVRGKSMPPDALTSVQELAAMPEIGPAVLLGQAWDGIRPIERTRSWWGSAADARAGVSYLTAPKDVRHAARTAAREAAAQLPPALDPFRTRALVKERLASVDELSAKKGKEASGVDITFDAVDDFAVDNRHVLKRADGTRPEIGVTASPEGVAGYESGLDGIGTSARAALDGIWDDLGVERVDTNAVRF